MLRRGLARNRVTSIPFDLGQLTPGNKSSSVGGNNRSIVAYNEASPVNGIITECYAFFGAADNAAFLTISPAGLIRDIGATFATGANALTTRTEALNIQVGDFLGLWLENGVFIDVDNTTSGIGYYQRSSSGIEAKPSVGDTRTITLISTDFELQAGGIGHT